jgi:hypothetical protein
MPHLRFNEEKHEYSLIVGGSTRIIPGVSNILQDAGVINYYSNNTEAMEFGTFIHYLTKEIDTAIDGEAADSVALYSTVKALPYLDCWDKFKKEYKFKAVIIEEPSYHPVYLYGGTPDRVGTIVYKGEAHLALVDIKTGMQHPSVKIQLAAYREILKANGVIPSLAVAVYLSDSEPVVVEEDHHPDQWATFLSALRLYNWKEKHFGRPNRV